MKIPRFIHQIWLGNEDMPPLMKEWRQKLIDLHLKWQCLLWHENRDVGNNVRLCCPTIDLMVLLDPKQQGMLQKAANLSQRTNIWRYNLVLQHGGLYIDTDVEPVLSFDRHVENLEAFTSARTNDPERYECALIGAVAGHPWLGDLVAHLHERDPSLSCDMGTKYFTDITLKHTDVKILPDKAFVSHCPVQWDFRNTPPPYIGNNRKPMTEDTVAVHHFSSHWFPKGFVPLGRLGGQ